MQRDFGISFVTQCAPVMAGLKPANLFRWVEPDGAALRRDPRRPGRMHSVRAGWRSLSSKAAPGRKHT